MTSYQIEQQIAQMERQLAAKRQELDYVRTIEDLERQRAELERRQRQAELDLQRFQANASLAEIAAQEPTANPEPVPEPVAAPGEPVADPEPVAAPDELPGTIPADIVRLVQNIVFRLKNLNPAGKTFDKDADEMINRVRTEGTPAIRLLTDLLGLPFNQGQYRRIVKNALRQQKGGAK